MEDKKAAVYERYPLFLPGIVSCGMLLIAALPIDEYAYYRILRWIVCGTVVFAAYKAYSLKRVFWIFSSVAIAILFNPLIPFHLAKESWVVIDIITAALLFATIWVLRPTKQVKENDGSK